MLASSFNRTVWYHKRHVISKEIRAFYHTKSKRGNRSESLIGLHGYAPNIKLMRDPRWGRNDEVPSEDPLLAGKYAKHYTQGMQQRDPPGLLENAGLHQTFYRLLRRGQSASL
jgi:beta-glucosidase